jgi:hypothetical protein
MADNIDGLQILEEKMHCTNMRNCPAENMHLCMLGFLLLVCQYWEHCGSMELEFEQC